MTDANAGKIPHVLVIMDGVGHREAVEDNAYLAAKTPNLSTMKAKHPNSLISGSGEDVGLPDGQMGNSEVGHMNLGAGRVLYQDFTRITKDIRTGDFFEHEVLIDAVEKAKAAHGAVHVMGLLSEGGVHSHEDHIVAMCELALNPNQGRIVSMVGRYFAMDRDNRWDRVEQAYRLMTEGEAARVVNSAVEGLEQAYAENENDEFVKATRIGEIVKVQDGDSIVFMNFRADRAREITRAFVEKDFTGFTRKVVPSLSKFVMLTRYQASIDAPVAYMPQLVNIYLV